MKFFKLAMVLAAMAALSGCTRIETGEVGLRVGLDKQVSQNELQPGSFNQNVFGEVLIFPVREIAVQLDNKQPQTSDNSTLQDFDLTVVYSVNPSAVSELWTQRSRSFHTLDTNKEWLLMYNFVSTLANNASYKAVRKHQALKVADNRVIIEQEIRSTISETLEAEKLDKAIVVNLVQVRNTLPAREIVESANAVVKAENDYKVKVQEVQTALREAERIAALNSNAKAIEYMHAQSLSTIAGAVAAGKVQTIILPYDFKGIVNVSAK